MDMCTRMDVCLLERRCPRVDEYNVCVVPRVAERDDQDD